MRHLFPSWQSPAPSLCADLTTVGLKYLVRLEAPTCETCHAHHTVLTHKAYKEKYSHAPILCLHGKAIKEMKITEEQAGTPVFLPAVIERVLPDEDSQSSRGSVGIPKLNLDAQKVGSKTNINVSYFRELEAMARRDHYNL